MVWYAAIKRAEENSEFGKFLAEPKMTKQSLRLFVFFACVVLTCQQTRGSSKDSSFDTSHEEEEQTSPAVEAIVTLLKRQLYALVGELEQEVRVQADTIGRMRRSVNGCDKTNREQEASIQILQGQLERCLHMDGSDKCEALKKELQEQKVQERRLISALESCRAINPSEISDCKEDSASQAQITTLKTQLEERDRLIAVLTKEQSQRTDQTSGLSGENKKLRDVLSDKDQEIDRLSQRLRISEEANSKLEAALRTCQAVTQASNPFTGTKDLCKQELLEITSLRNSLTTCRKAASDCDKCSSELETKREQLAQLKTMLEGRDYDIPRIRKALKYYSEFL